MDEKIKWRPGGRKAIRYASMHASDIVQQQTLILFRNQILETAVVFNKTDQLISMLTWGLGKEL